MREGDELVVTRVDRLARSFLDLQEIVRDLTIRRVNLKATEQPFDSSTLVRKCFLDMLGVFAEFETNLRCERQLRGIAKAKEKGSTMVARRWMIQESRRVRRKISQSLIYARI